MSFFAYDEIYVCEEFWRKSPRDFTWRLCVRYPDKSVKEFGILDYSALLPWSVDKIYFVIKKFGSIPAGLLEEIPDDVLAELPISILDKML